MQWSEKSTEDARTMRRRGCCRGLILLLALGPMIPALAADDPYLDMLNAEAHSGGSRVDRASVEKPETGGGEAPATAVNVDRTEFERHFGEVRPSTYSAYVKLSEAQKQEVYERFKESGDYNKLVLDVMRLRFQP